MITHIDYSISEAITQFKTLIFDYPIIYYFLGAAVVFGILILINLNTRNAFIMTFVVEVLAFIFIFYYRGLDLIGHIDTIFNIHFYQNIFFYYWNVIVGLLIMHFVLNGRSDKITKYIVLVSYILTIVNLAYSFYISKIVSNNCTLL